MSYSISPSTQAVSVSPINYATSLPSYTPTSTSSNTLRQDCTCSPSLVNAASSSYHSILYLTDLEWIISFVLVGSFILLSLINAVYYYMKYKKEETLRLSLETKVNYRRSYSSIRNLL